MNQNLRALNHARKLVRAYVYNGIVFKEACLCWIGRCRNYGEISYADSFFSRMQKSAGEPLSEDIARVLSAKMEEIICADIQGNERIGIAKSCYVHSVSAEGRRKAFVNWLHLCKTRSEIEAALSRAERLNDADCVKLARERLDEII